MNDSLVDSYLNEMENSEVDHSFFRRVFYALAEYKGEVPFYVFPKLLKNWGKQRLFYAILELSCQNEIKEVYSQLAYRCKGKLESKETSSSEIINLKDYEKKKKKEEFLEDL